MTSAVQTAVVVQAAGQLAMRHDVVVPQLQPDMVMVKTAAVAINPVDAKMLDYSPVVGAVHGHDFAGTVVALGAQAPSHLRVGDRVAGPVIGAFAEYVGAYGDLLLKVPDRMTWEEAASLGMGMATALLALFNEMQVPASLDRLRAGGAGPEADKEEADKKEEDSQYVLVAGGSTSTGTRTMQLLKCCGLQPIATCSPANFGLAARFGAEQMFDYHSATCAADIRAYTGNELAYALDCVGEADTTALCYAALGRAGGRYVALEPFRQAVAQLRPLTVTASWVMALTIFGHKVELNGEYGREARPEDREFGRRAFAAAQTLLDAGLLDAHPVKVMEGGWLGVIEGVNIIRRGGLSGQKLAYPVA